MEKHLTDPLTCEEINEIECLNAGNELLVKEICRLEDEKLRAKEARRKPLKPEDLDSHASAEYIRQIKILDANSPIIDLLQQWRLARLQCASYSETIEEVQVNFVEMKRLHAKLLKLRGS